MVRPLIAIAAALILAACGQSEPSVEQVSTQSAPAANGDGRIAKTLFGAMSFTSRQTSDPLGGYSRGCQAGARQLEETGPTWQAMRLNRNRNWAQPVTIDFIQDLSRFAATQPGWAGLYVGDLSQPRGGPMTSGHASHQSGLDADIWMLPPTTLALSPAQRESLSSISMQRSGGAYTNDRFSAQHMNILREAASDPRVSRIFVFAGAKVAMCSAETGDRSWLRKIRPWGGHHAHFHVRLNCPRGASGCEDQAPPPPGDGCADAQAWVNNILTPPPPDPTAPPPRARRDLTMADLPAQCSTVLTSN